MRPPYWVRTFASGMRVKTSGYLDQEDSDREDLVIDINSLILFPCWASTHVRSINKEV